ncbi:hypothetical protein E4S40_07130 [Algoriphagus kandeliae]|uniref:Uncharacterized protein n=1 Tax=Algoriphagus kandeliae TaxID=2562278 RepID=A0A4Y9QTT1_9BACT|nr:DUF6428 family protein [Algoriphagus kandeliae]TFV95991.1 hypothetical protein E4S40_07130 [Algoriphagus kandeliae]
MRLSEVKEALTQIDHLHFYLPNGVQIPDHFHITEVGKVSRHFIDCGGTIRKEEVINFQLFTADDYDHRLKAQKLLSIIELSEKHLNLEDLDIEVEYQGDTIGKYGLEFKQGGFFLTKTFTDCLAKDQCGIPAKKPKIRLSTLQSQQSECLPGSGCC